MLIIKSKHDKKGPHNTRAYSDKADQYRQTRPEQIIKQGKLDQNRWKLVITIMLLSIN